MEPPTVHKNDGKHDPKGLIFQAFLDLRTDGLWTNRASFRVTLTGLLLSHQNCGYLNDAEHKALLGLVHYDDRRRLRATFTPTSVWAPLTQEEVLRFGTPKAGAPNDELDPKEPEAPVEPEAPEPHHASNGGGASLLFDPPLAATYIAQGWGFTSKGASIVARFWRSYRDFPAPLPGSDRKTPLWSYLAVAAWTAVHQDDILRARGRGIRQVAARTETRKDAVIAELRGELAALRARSNGAPGGAP